MHDTGVDPGCLIKYENVLIQLCTVVFEGISKLSQRLYKRCPSLNVHESRLSVMSRKRREEIKLLMGVDPSRR